MKLMRYFVYYEPEALEVRPHILAEVVRDVGDDGRFREWSAAASLAGDKCQILTRDELLQLSDGSLALTAWETENDREFDIDTLQRLALIDRVEAGTPARERHLRLVRPEPPAIPDVIATLPPIAERGDDRAKT